MIITVDFGHCTSGEDRGANGYLNEEIIDREYGNLVIAGLQKLGNTVYNVTPTQVNLTLNQSLAYRVSMANYYKSDLHLCLHVNAYETDQAEGCEVEYISDAGRVYADKISAEISKALEVINRGAKLDKNLYVLKYTNMTSVLVEPFFCDVKSDCDKYNAEKLADAIIKGITGQTVYNKPQSVVVTKYDESAPTGNNIFNIPGTTAYIEQPEDGRLIIHKDRGNYIAIGKGFIDAYWNDNNGNLGSKRINN